jgi:carbon-monoxide dehydrogenase large subunit
MNDGMAPKNPTRQRPAHAETMRRREDLALITGKGQYVGDMHRPGMLHTSFVYSPYPHARIVALDVSAARAYPGVVMVVTADEVRHLGGLLTGLDPASSWTPQPCLADGVVHFMGEPVAAVVAESEAGAEDAAALLEIVSSTHSIRYVTK